MREIRPAFLVLLFVGVALLISGGILLSRLPPDPDPARTPSAGPPETGTARSPQPVAPGQSVPADRTSPGQPPDGSAPTLPAGRSAAANPASAVQSGDAVTDIPDDEILPDPVFEQTVGWLLELSRREDPESLAGILAMLDHPDARIRHEAVEAAIQFGSREAIPILRAAAEAARDPTERAELNEAADYLALPTLTEVLRRRAALREAADNPQPTPEQPE